MEEALSAADGRGSAGSAAAPQCVRDRLGRGNFRPSGRPAEVERLALYAAQTKPPWAQGLRLLRKLRRGARSLALATPCETYAVLRPRPWLQKAMLPCASTARHPHPPDNPSPAPSPRRLTRARSLSLPPACSYLRRLHAASGGGPVVGLHMRTGFADWQWYSATHEL